MYEMYTMYIHKCDMFMTKTSLFIKCHFFMFFDVFHQNDENMKTGVTMFYTPILVPHAKEPDHIDMYLA